MLIPSLTSDEHISLLELSEIEELEKKTAPTGGGETVLPLRKKAQ